MLWPFQLPAPLAGLLTKALESLYKLLAYNRENYHESVAPPRFRSVQSSSPVPFSTQISQHSLPRKHESRERLEAAFSIALQYHEQIGTTRIANLSDL